MKQLVKESINEKFTEETSDPISDMNIGGFSFDALRKGAIIAAKVPKLSLKTNNDGYFTYPGKGHDLPVHFPLLVIDVRDYIIPGTKEIKIYKDNANLEEVKKLREQFKTTEGEFRGRWGTSTRMILNKKKFERMFNIIERGF